MTTFLPVFGVLLGVAAGLLALAPVVIGSVLAHRFFTKVVDGIIAGQDEPQK